jgi:hypothetical protein
MPRKDLKMTRSIGLEVGCALTRTVEEHPALEEYGFGDNRTKATRPQ